MPSVLHVEMNMTVRFCCAGFVSADGFHRINIPQQAVKAHSLAEKLLHQGLE